MHTSYVDGCAAGLLGNDRLPVAKRWRVMVTHTGVASSLSSFRCDKSHDHSPRFVLPSRNTTLSGDTVSEGFGESGVTKFLCAAISPSILVVRPSCQRNGPLRFEDAMGRLPFDEGQFLLVLLCLCFATQGS